MAEQMTPISRAVSDILTGAYNKKRLTQEVVAERAGMSVWTLQKKLKARAPISATDLVVLSNAIGVNPTSVLEEAMSDVEHAERLASEGVASISDHRNKKTPATMTDDELDAIQKKAGINDDELEQDEPEIP